MPRVSKVHFTCVKCEKAKFSKTKYSGPTCVTCQKISRGVKYAPDLIKQKAWRLANKEKVIKAQLKYREKPETREKEKRISESYRKRFPHIKAAQQARRRALKKKACPPWVDRLKLKEIYSLCPKGMEVDHIIPLQNKLVCGLHVPWNLQYLMPEDNKSKGNRF